MKKTPALRFFKCYAALVGAFDPAEVIFILYMEQMTALCRMGYNTTHSQQYHMMRMAIGKRLFKRKGFGHQIQYWGNQEIRR